jgi:aryl-alcohol dehydrogenase-like predicted oxidoreductase
MSRTRRDFLRSGALTAVTATSVLAAASDNPKNMPKRILGRTGGEVSILAFGCGSRFLQYSAEKGIEALNHALDLGITYVDTAYGYGDGESEQRVGQVMKTRRKQVWLTTKVLDRKGDQAMRTIEGSLKRLQTDHIDLIHVHSLSNADDLAQIEAKDGVLSRLYQLRDQKVIRAVGITSHTDPAVLRTALDRNDFDCTQMALNAARAGMAKPDGGFGMTMLEQSFETLALPVARRKNMGVIAMKVFAQEGLSGKAPAEKLIRYALSLPVTAAVIGMPTLDFINQNIAVAKNFQPLPATEMRDLSHELATQHKARLDQHFADHFDA